MSYKQKIVSAFAAGFAVVSFSAFASAQDSASQTQSDSTQRQEKGEHRRGENRFGKEGHHHDGGKMVMREFSQLNLTDAQKQQIREIMQTSRGDAADQGAHQEMRQLAQAKHDGVITAEQTERLKTLRQQMHQNAEQMKQKIAAVLTPEQLTQLEQLKQQRREKMKEHRRMRENQKDSDAPNDN